MQNNKDKLLDFLCANPHWDDRYPVRVRNALCNLNLPSNLVALSIPDIERVKFSNFGPTSKRDFCEVAASFGMKPGDTSDFVRANADFFIEGKITEWETNARFPDFRQSYDTRPVYRYTRSTVGINQVEVGEIPMSDLREKVAEFVEGFTPQAVSLPTVEKKQEFDLQWMKAYLPAEKVPNIRPSFLKAVLDEVLSDPANEPHIDALKLATMRALEKRFG